MPELINPNQPTREEVVAHNMKVAKMNLASELASSLCKNESFASSVSAKNLSLYAIEVAETIMETFSLMQKSGGGIQ